MTQPDPNYERDIRWRQLQMRDEGYAPYEWGLRWRRRFRLLMLFGILEHAFLLWRGCG